MRFLTKFKFRSAQMDSNRHQQSAPHSRYNSHPPLRNLRILQKKRTSNFREDETRILIQLWGSPQIQNKLYLTHRKEPVMRLLALNMQQRGFYRTPDEIKTRIRNLKCLYHRIKRTVQSGSGYGTVDPDWPHFRAMDRILSRKQFPKRDLYKDNVLEGPRCEDIKQEVDDEIDINDEMETYTAISMGGGGSDCNDEPSSMSLFLPQENEPQSTEEVPSKKVQTNSNPQTINPNKSKSIATNSSISMTTQTTMTTNSLKPNISNNPSLPTIPFPLLILNNLQPSTNKTLINDKTSSSHGTLQTSSLTITPKLSVTTNNSNCTANDTNFDEKSQRVPPLENQLLKQLIDVQKENLLIERQRLEVDKQRLEIEQSISKRLLALTPTLQYLLEKIDNGTVEKRQNFDKNTKRSHFDDENDDDLVLERRVIKRALNSNNELEIIVKENKMLKKMMCQSIKNLLVESTTTNNDSGNEEEIGDKSN